MWPFSCYGFSLWSYSVTWLKNLLTIPVSSLVVDPLLTFMRTYTYPKLRFYCILVSQHAIFMHLFLCPSFLPPLLESASITGPAITHPHCLVLDESLFRTLKLKRYSQAQTFHGMCACYYSTQALWQGYYSTVSFKACLVFSTEVKSESRIKLWFLNFQEMTYCLWYQIWLKLGNVNAIWFCWRQRIKLFPLTKE